MAAPLLLFVPTCLPSLLGNGGSALAKTTSYLGQLLLSQGDFNAEVGPYLALIKHLQLVYFRFHGF